MHEDKYYGQGFFRMPWAFVHTLSANEAIVLVVMMDIIKEDIEEGQDDDSWVKMHSPRLQKVIPMHSPRNLRRAINSLEHKSIIEVKFIERPTFARDPMKRWVRIDMDALRAWIDEFTQGGHETTMSMDR